MLDLLGRVVDCGERRARRPAARGMTLLYHKIWRMKARISRAEQKSAGDCGPAEGGLAAPPAFSLRTALFVRQQPKISLRPAAKFGILRP